jgi:restriction endonuclease S subunit
MEEQKKLAELLWAANDLKEKYKKAITATDEMLKAKFREMFGCVGNGERGMGNGEDFNVEAQRCRVVSVPIGLIGDVYTGSTPSMKVAEYYENREIPFYKPSDFQEGITTLVMSEFYVDKRAESKCRMFDVGAVLVTCIGTVGKVGLATMPGTCNQQINFIVPNSKIDSKYLACAMVFVGEKMAESAKASVVPIINKTEFCNYKIPLPPISLQREFVAIAEKAEAAKASLKKSIADIETLIKGLLN